MKRILYTIITITLGCAPTCEEPAETTPSEAQDDPDPCSLSCTEDRDCNTDHPYCVKGACRDTPTGAES